MNLAHGSRWSRATSALRYRDFRILWVGMLVGNAGSWMQKVTTAWLLYQITKSEVWLGADAFASGIPTVLLLPWGGVLADRVSRRSLLIWTNLISAALAFVLAGLQAARVLHLWHIMSVSIASGIVQAAMVPASTSLLPALVGEENISDAIALNSAQFNLSRVVGPALGGAAMIYLGAAWSFALNAVSFLVLLVAFFLISHVPPVKHTEESIGRTFKGGLQFVRKHEDVGFLLTLVFLAAFFGAPAVSMLPALVKTVLYRDASSYSILLSAFGGGAVIAALVIATIDDGKHSFKWHAATLAAFGVMQAALVLCRHLAAAVSVTALAGVFFVGTMIRLGTAILQTTPDVYRGRVSSFQQLLFRSGQPIGALAAGIAARHLGVRTAFVWFGGGIFTFAILTLQLRKHAK